jgi:hypothetical protein
MTGNENQIKIFCIIMYKEILFDQKVIIDLIAQLRLAKNILDRGLHYKFRKLQKILDDSKPFLILILINEARRNIDYKNIRKNYHLLDFCTLLRELETVQFLNEVQNGQRNINRRNQDLLKGMGVGPSTPTHDDPNTPSNESSSNEFYTPPSTPRQSDAAKNKRNIPVDVRKPYKDVFVDIPIYLHRIEGLSKYYDKKDAFLLIKQSNSTVELPIPSYTNTTLVLNTAIRFKYNTQIHDPLEFTLVTSSDKTLHGIIDKKDLAIINKNKMVQILLKEEGTNDVHGILLATIGSENMVGGVPTFSIDVPTNRNLSVKFHVPNNEPNEPRIQSINPKYNNNNFPGF